MSGLLHTIMPREDKFFALYERQAANLVEAADALARLFAGEAAAETRDRIRQIETAADDVTREVMHAVRRSFITPFDRSAITALISAMDDVVDEIWHTAKTAGIYGVETFDPGLRQAAGLAAEAARLVAEAIPLMRNVRRNGARLHEITEAIVLLESRGDGLHDEGLARLFQAHGPEAMRAFFVGWELGRYVERVLDRLQDVADEIQGIVIDHA